MAFSEGAARYQNFQPSAQARTSISVPYAQCQLLVGKYEYPPEEGMSEPKVQKYVPGVLCSNTTS